MKVVAARAFETPVNPKSVKVPILLNDEFYIGYLPEAPAETVRRMRRFIFAVFGFAVVSAFLFVIAQKPFAASFFEFLQEREFSGNLIAQPHPMLVMLRPSNTGELPASSRYYLVGEGKFGADQEAAAWDGKTVKLRGKLIYREDQTMIEVAPGSIQEEVLPGKNLSSLSTQKKNLGAFTLRGEIVDSKCFLGVMNPGDLKTHKSCAVRCISGGSPPLFIVRQSNRVWYFLLLSAEGESVNQFVLDLVARPIEIHGQVWQEDDLLMLHADPAKYRVLD